MDEIRRNGQRVRAIERQAGAFRNAEAWFQKIASRDPEIPLSGELAQTRRRRPNHLKSLRVEVFAQRLDNVRRFNMLSVPTLYRTLTHFELARRTRAGAEEASS